MLDFQSALAADPRLRDWMHYGSYVDTARKILYVETPKCGCSSIKHFLLDSLVPGHSLRFNPLTPETRLDMMIHDRSQNPLQRLTQFSGDALRDIIEGPGWFRFCVLRHPAERFFSAWRDKIFLCEPGFEAYLHPDGRRFIEFSDFFAKAMREDPLACNPHWRSQTVLVRPDDIAYSKIYDISELSDLPGDLAEHLGTEVGVLPRINESLPISPDGFLTPEIISGLRDFYQLDFNRFAFADLKVSWAAPRTAAELVTGFTDAIFDRNRMIAAYGDCLRQMLTPRT